MRKDRRLSAEERRDAVAALSILEPFRMTLSTAALLATGSDAPIVSAPLGRAVDEYLQEVRARLRESTVRQYEGDLYRLLDVYPDAQVADLTRDRLEAFLGACGGQAGMFRSVRAFLRWAARRNPPYLRPDPTREMTPPRGRKQGEVRFLSVDEVRSALPACGRYQSALALALFAGVRTEELAGVGKEPLRWRHLRMEEQIVRIPAEVAKTGRSRILEGLPANLWTWLDPGPDADPVCPGLGVEAVRRFQTAAGYRDRAGRTLRRWPQNALRHSFATYATAHWSDPGRVSMLLGHEGNPSLLHRHYRGLATRAEARRFFSIRKR